MALVTRGVQANTLMDSRRMRSAAAALICAAICRVGFAFDGVVLTAGRIETPYASATGVRLSLNLAAPEGASGRVQANSIDLGSKLGRYTSIDLRCARIQLGTAKLSCSGGRLAARGGLIDPLSFRGGAGLDIPHDVLAIDGSLPVAGGRAHLTGRIAAGNWSVRAKADGLDVPALRRLTTQWVSVPAEYSLSGRVDAIADIASRAQGIRVAATARTTALGLSNQAGTIAGQKVVADFTLTAVVDQRKADLQVEVRGRGGQLLIGPMLADFGPHPLDLRATGRLRGGTLELGTFHVDQRGVLDADGTARIVLGSASGERLGVDEARIRIARLEFPAAYTSFLQLPLAATEFGALQTTGRASALLEITHGQPMRLDVTLDDLDIDDPASRLDVDNLSGAIHWSAMGQSAPSFLSLNESRFYGLEIGATRLDFRLQGSAFRLTHETRIPVLDGAVVVRSLSGTGLGQPDAAARFDASIEPISMPQLCRAFGWPEMQGSLSGRVPNMQYRDRTLTFGGDVVANVFDGTVRGANIRLIDPLGPWPQLQADVTARDLNLDLVTRTFPIGSITGQLNADLIGLQLFDWSPIAFDARLYTTPGDRSRHLISQKAVTSLAGVGGGGGLVTSALQSGVLRFFRTFHYDRIGLSCVLRNGVCRMSGVERAGPGSYYIVKGRGLPRIDIIGNEGLVNWSQLLSQTESAMRSGGVVVH